MWSETGGYRVSGPEKAHASSIRARRRGRREGVAAGRDCLSGPTGSFGRGRGDRKGRRDGDEGVEGVVKVDAEVRGRQADGRRVRWWKWESRKRSWGDGERFVDGADADGLLMDVGKLETGDWKRKTGDDTARWGVVKIDARSRG